MKRISRRICTKEFKRKAIKLVTLKIKPWHGSVAD